jgi:hypothetical protein
VVDGEQPSAGAGGHLPGERKAILLSPEKDTAEIEALSRSAGMRVVGTFVQRVETPNPKYFLGEGKVERISKRRKSGKKGRGGNRRPRRHPGRRRWR